MVDVARLALYAAIFFTILGACVGLMGVWIDEFWESDFGPKSIWTFAILAVASIIVAAITKWLA